MKKIELHGKRGNGKFAIVDDEDYENVNKYKWYLDKSGYAQLGWDVINHKKAHYKMHKFILNSPKGVGTDHINHDKLDNRRCNLRICTDSENMANIKITKANKSGYRGVYFRKDKNKWSGQVNFNYKTISIGCYKTKQEAIEAHKKIYKQIWGEWACKR